MIASYDAAIKEFFSLKLKGKPVPIVGPVNPMRAFAMMSQLVTKEGQINPQVNNTDRFVPLPFISIYRLPPVQSLDRFRRADLRHMQYDDDGNSILQSRMPFPYDIEYQLDIWCEYEDDLVTLTESLLRKYKGPMTYISIDHGPPHGEYNIATFFENGMDTSELESDAEDRILRYTLTIKVEGFLSFPARKVKTVRKEQIYVSVAENPNTQPTVYEEVLINEYKE
jgi:hypothetical protein